MKTGEGDPSTPSEAVAMSVLIEMVGDAQRAAPLWIAVRVGYSLRTFVGRFASSVWPLDVWSSTGTGSLAWRVLRPTT